MVSRLVGGELESVTSSAGCFVEGWRNETADQVDQLSRVTCQYRVNTR